MDTVYVPTRVEIIRTLDRLSELANTSPTIAEVESELIDQLDQLQCDIVNRAAIDITMCR